MAKTGLSFAMTRYGHQGRRRTGPVGRQAIVMAAADALGPLGDFGSNLRLAHCKVCGAPLPKGEGTTMVLYSRNGYNFSVYFVCRRDAEWIGGGMLDAQGKRPSEAGYDRSIWKEAPNG